MAQSRNQLKEASGGSRLKADLGVLEKWRISDANTFGQTLLQFEKDLVEMTDTQEASRQTLRQVNCSLLKGELRAVSISILTPPSFSQHMSRRDCSFQQGKDR